MIVFNKLVLYAPLLAGYRYFRSSQSAMAALAHRFVDQLLSAIENVTLNTLNTDIDNLIMNVEG